MKLLQRIRYRQVCDKIIRALVIGFVAFMICMDSPLNPMRAKGYPMGDSSVFKSMAFFMSKGKIPYKDIFDHKGPLIYIYNWIGIQIAYWRGIWVIELVSMVVAVYYLYRIAHIWCSKWWSCLIIIISVLPLFTYFEEGNLVEEYAMPFIAGALFFFCDYMVSGKINNIRLFLSGLYFGAVCMLRINMISIWVVFCTGILIKELYDKHIKEMVKFISLFLVGTSAILIPIIIWLSVHAAIKDFWNVYIIFNIKYSVEQSTIGRCLTIIFFLKEAILLITLLIMIVIMKKQYCLFNTMYAICFLLSFMSVSMSGYQYAHYAMVLVPLFVYPIAYALNRMTKDANVSIVSYAIIICLLGIQVCPAWIQYVELLMQRQTIQYDYQNDFLAQMCDYIRANSNEADEITVYGSDNIIYLLSHRITASKYSYQTPIGEIDNSIYNGYFEDITEKKPKFIIVPENNLDNKMLDFTTVNGYKIVGTWGAYNLYAINNM